MNFDADTLWSTNNNNNFKGDGIYINAADEDFSLGSEFYYDKDGDGGDPVLGLDGKLLMGADSEITNTDGDFLIDNAGVAINSDEFNRFKFTSDGSVVGRLYHNSTLQRLTVNANGAGHSIELDADQNIYLQHGADLILVDIPNSEPGASARVWNDNGILKLSGSSGPIQLPTYTDAQRNNLTGLQEGMVIWNTDDNRIQVYNGSGWDRVSEV